MLMNFLPKLDRLNYRELHLCSGLLRTRIMLGTFYMKNTYKFLGLSCMVLAVSACQSAPRQYNGNVGYQIEHQSASSATLAYTLAAA